MVGISRSLQADRRIPKAIIEADGVGLNGNAAGTALLLNAGPGLSRISREETKLRHRLRPHPSRTCRENKKPLSERDMCTNFITLAVVRGQTIK